MIGYRKNKIKETPFQKIINIVIALVVPVCVLILWESIVNAGLVKPTLLPPPTKLWKTFCSLIDSGKLQSGLLISFKRVVSGFFIGSVAGGILGFIMGPLDLCGTVHLLILRYGGGQKPQKVQSPTNL